MGYDPEQVYHSQDSYHQSESIYQPEQSDAPKQAYDHELETQVPTAVIPEVPSALDTQPAPIVSPTEPVSDQVHFMVKERVSVTGNRDGGLETLEVKGDLLLKITDPASTRLSILMDAQERFGGAEVQYRTHPHVDKQPWASERKIALRDPKREFPVNQQVGVLRWRAVTKDESVLPLSITVWVNPSGDGASEVVIEYQLENTSLVLSDVVFAIPVPVGVLPEVSEPENGLYEVDPTNSRVLWRLPSVSDLNASASFELSVPNGADSADVFFPVSVDFSAEQTLLPLQILQVFDTRSGALQPFSNEALLVADNYKIQ